MKPKKKSLRIWRKRKKSQKVTKMKMRNHLKTMPPLARMTATTTTSMPRRSLTRMTTISTWKRILSGGKRILMKRADLQVRIIRPGSLRKTRVRRQMTTTRKKMIELVDSTSQSWN